MKDGDSLKLLRMKAILRALLRFLRDLKLISQVSPGYRSLIFSSVISRIRRRLCMIIYTALERFLEKLRIKYFSKP